VNFINKLERKFGRYAIRHLTRYIIIAYIIGYVLWIISAYTNFPIQLWLSLNPGAIMSGQIWRIVSWVLIPPSSFNIFTIIMLFCYYQLGTLLERVWGDFLYDFYIFFGLIMTIIGAFIMYFAGGAAMIEMTGGLMFSTYYVSLSIFLGFAMTFPDQQMLLFFIIPIKIKYLAVFDVAYLTYFMIVGDWMTRVQIICSLAATILFFLMTRGAILKNRMKSMYGGERFNAGSSSPKPKKTGNGRTGSGNAGRSGARNNGRTAAGNAGAGGAPIHRCTICGRTERDNPNLEFRYCSRCRGNHEYCSDHLFSHVHIQ